MTTFSAPLGTVTHGLFEMLGGSCNLHLHAAPEAGYRDAEVLAAGRFEGREPEIRIDDGRVRMGYRRSFSDFAFDWRRTRADLALSRLVPWDILVRGGVSGLHADLGGVRLASLEISGGVSDAQVRLPRPSGTVRVFVLGGVNQLRLSRPAEIPMQVSVHGGASDLVVDTLALGAVGGRFHWETPGFADATDRYVIEVHGGVSSARLRGEEARSHAVVDAGVLDQAPLAAGA
jgi:hypothetical protein